MAVRMKPAAEIAKMKRSKKYREYLRGGLDNDAVLYNKQHNGDDWGSYLYGNNSRMYYNTDDSDVTLRMIGNDEEDANP